MFEDESLKLRLYIYPVLFFALGTVAAFNIGWEWFAMFMYFLGFAVLFHVALVSLIRERRMFIEAETDRLKAQKELYDTVEAMDTEARYAFGLSYVPTEVKVKVNKTETEGNELSLLWRKIPIVPYKLKVIAQAAINGEGFTVRKWAGEGKLLSRDEWELAHETMVQLGMLEQIGTDPREGFMWTSMGEDVLRQIVRDTL